MIAGQDDRRILIPWLLLAPFHEVRYLIVRALDDIGILLFILIITQLADVTVRIMRIDGQKCEVKRLFF